MIYDVYGTKIEVLRSEGTWKVFFIGDTGLKRATGDIVIPPHVEEADIGQYLGDIRHEYASAQHREVKCLG